MAESLPLPQALRFVATDSEWRVIEPYLTDDNFPAGMNSYVKDGEEAFRDAERLVADLEKRLAAALSDGCLTARGRQAGSSRLTDIDGRGCDELEVLGEDGRGLRIYGLDFTYVVITKRAPGAGGRLAEKRALRNAMVAALTPHIADLSRQERQTNYVELRAFLAGQGISGFATSFLKTCAAEAGLTKDMIRPGRPKNNAEKE